MALDDASLAEVGRLYREGRLKLAEIGRPYGLAPSAISHLARVHGWPMRRKLKARAPQVTALSTPKTRALARRLCDAITKKLEHMEKGMTSGELSSADYERDAKAVPWLECPAVPCGEIVTWVAEPSGARSPRVTSPVMAKPCSSWTGEVQ